MLSLTGKTSLDDCCNTPSDSLDGPQRTSSVRSPSENQGTNNFSRTYRHTRSRRQSGLTALLPRTYKQNHSSYHTVGSM